MATLVGGGAECGTVTGCMPAEPQPAARQPHKANRRESTADTGVTPEWQRTGWDSGFTVAPASRIHQIRNGINQTKYFITFIRHLIKDPMDIGKRSSYAAGCPILNSRTLRKGCVTETIDAPEAEVRFRN